MNEKDNLEQEFDLESIIREFSDAPEKEPEIVQVEEESNDSPEEFLVETSETDEPKTSVEEPIPVIMEELTPVVEETVVPEETVRLYVPSENEAVEPEQPVVTAETVRLEPVEAPKEKNIKQEMPVQTEEPAQPEETPEPVQDAVTSDTVRIERIPEVQGTVRNAKPIRDESEQETAPTQEPFSEKWEPEYEQPISEYVPQQPLTFRPKSRLQELKKKLVNGPERLYYSISELGLGKLQAAIFFNLLVVLLSAGATALYVMGMVQPNRLKLMVFGQFLAMMISALLGCFQLIEGGIDLFKGRFSLNTMLLVSFGICCADGVLCLQQLRVPCCAAFSLQMTMSLWSTYQNRYTKLGQLDTMRKATQLNSVYAVDGFDDKRKGLLRGQGEVEHYMDNHDDKPTQQKVLSFYALAVLVATIGAGVLAGVRHNVSAAVQVAAVTTLAALPASVFVVVSRPMAVLERRLHKTGTVLCGWKGVRGLGGKALFPLTHEDLFPEGSVKMNGVKFFGDRQPDEIIAYAASLIKVGGGTLEPLFDQLLDSRNGRHYDPVNFNRYEGGIGGEINGEPVLVGTVAFLQNLDVEIPDGIRISSAVCVAVDGELCGLFAVTYEKAKSTAAGLATLCGYKKLKPILLTGDFMLSPTFLRRIYGLNPKKVIFPDEETRTRLQEAMEAEGEKVSLAVVTKNGLASYAYAITGARSLKTAMNLGVVIHMIGGILGMLMMLLLAYLGQTTLLTPANLFLYELIWLIPGLLVTEWTRSI